MFWPGIGDRVGVVGERDLEDDAVAFQGGEPVVPELLLLPADAGHVDGPADPREHLVLGHSRRDVANISGVSTCRDVTRWPAAS